MRYIFFFSLLLLTACGKNEFYLEFDLKPDVTDNYNVTYYATDVKGGVTVQAVASVREGKCLLNGLTKRPTLVYITARRSKLPLVVMAGRKDKIKISGDNPQPLSWKVEGGDLNDIMWQWREDNIKILEEAIPDSVNNAVRTFVEENEDSPVSTILLQCYFDRKTNERKYSELMASLSGAAKDSRWLDMIGRSDQLFHSYSYPARLQSLVMRSIKEGGDTLKINEKNPVLMFFWQTGTNDHKDMIDSLKTLDKEFPDSVNLIADVCLDVDSAAWRSAIKRDSLVNVKRFWSPLGLMDPKMQKFRVNAIPYYIVFDKEGGQSYRGRDLKDAMQEYRKLMLEKDSI